jgi:hypothetical protein
MPFQIIGWLIKKITPWLFKMTFMSRLQKVKTRKLQLAGTGERLMISNSYNRHNARSPVPTRKNLLFAGDSFIARTKHL